MVFLSFVIDVYSAKDRRLAARGPHARRPRPGCPADGSHTPPPGADVDLIHHSDPGSQYTSSTPAVLDDHRILGSLGSVGDAYDNALAESFVDTFKTELIADRAWQTRDQLEFATVDGSGGTTASACTSPSATSRPPSSRL